jgi:hypothetical protein
LPPDLTGFPALEQSPQVQLAEQMRWPQPLRQGSFTPGSQAHPVSLLLPSRGEIGPSGGEVGPSVFGFEQEETGPETQM